MSSISRQLPSPAMIVALLALVVALAGSSYAAFKVGAEDLEKDSVTSSKIKNKTIGEKDVSSKARDALRGAQGPSGAPGAPGPTASAATSSPVGPPGSAGGPCCGQYEGVISTDVVMPFAGRLIATASLGFGTVDGSYHGTVQCRLQVAPAPAFTTFTDIGREASAVAQVTSGTSSAGDVALVAGVDLAAGTYRVRVGCTNGAPSDWRLEGGDLAAVATAG